MTKQYPIGTRIRYKGPSHGGWWEHGWKGVIVGMYNEYPLIYLPKSTFESEYSTMGCRVTVQTSWNSLEILSKKNEQLEFEFMHEK